MKDELKEARDLAERYRNQVIGSSALQMEMGSGDPAESFLPELRETHRLPWEKPRV